MGFYLNAFLLEVAGSLCLICCNCVQLYVQLHFRWRFDIVLRNWAGVDAGSAGTLLLVAKLADAVADPLIGWASDETRVAHTQTTRTYSTDRQH